VNPQITEKLYSASVSTFRQLCFVQPEKADPDPNPNWKVEAQSSVDFWGPCHGKLIVTLYGDVLGDLVKGMMGEDAELEENILNESLKEIVNVICGSAIAGLSEGSANYHIGSPDIGAVNENAPPVVPSASVSIGFGSGRAEVALSVFKGREDRGI